MSAGREVSFENERFLFRIFFLWDTCALVAPLSCRWRAVRGTAGVPVLGESTIARLSSVFYGVREDQVCCTSRVLWHSLPRVWL